jgi:hypothetical protein
MPFASIAAVTLALIAGATYAGTHAGGGEVRFTVAADGTRVDSYRIRDVPGDTCRFHAGGVAEEWEGAAIVNRAFEYRLHDALLFEGTFAEDDVTATGTLRMFNREVPGVKPACDTGTVTWTATTPPPPAPPDGPPPVGEPPLLPGGPPANEATATYRTTITLRRRGARRLTGRLRSPSRACSTRRKVVLKRGSKRIASARSSSDGRFTFKRRSSTRGRKVRASVARVAVAQSICAASRSKTVRG